MTSPDTNILAIFVSQGCVTNKSNSELVLCSGTGCIWGHNYNLLNSVCVCQTLHECVSTQKLCTYARMTTHRCKDAKALIRLVNEEITLWWAHVITIYVSGSSAAQLNVFTVFPLVPVAAPAITKQPLKNKQTTKQPQFNRESLQVKSL